MIRANDPARKSWIHVPQDSDFPIQNIPFGAAKDPSGKRFIATRIGDTVIKLNYLAEQGFLDGCNLPEGVFSNGYLNSFMELSKKEWRAVRDRLADLFDELNDELPRDSSDFQLDIQEVEMVMPVKIGDYTDFYSSRQHATNVGTMFRDPDNALLPNWLHIPVGYHGRASSVIVSGVDIHRPKGQQKPDAESGPVFGPSKMLDFELEVGFFTGQGKALGDSISTAEAEDYIFGLVLFNDWSARDLQKWEYVPLGPFLAKNFASHISPWIVTLDALEPFKIEGEKQEPEVLPYLKFDGPKTYDVNLEVLIENDKFPAHKIANSNFKYMYWNMVQQLTHHTVNGCNINAGDLLASGTISGNNPEEYGSMLELAWKGTKPLQMPDGSERKFILDGDTVIMRGHCQANGYRIGFGEVKAKVLPAK